MISKQFLLVVTASLACQSTDQSASSGIDTASLGAGGGPPEAPAWTVGFSTEFPEPAPCPRGEPTFFFLNGVDVEQDWQSEILTELGLDPSAIYLRTPFYPNGTAIGPGGGVVWQVCVEDETAGLARVIDGYTDFGETIYSIATADSTSELVDVSPFLFHEASGEPILIESDSSDLDSWRFQIHASDGRSATTVVQGVIDDGVFQHQPFSPVLAGTFEYGNPFLGDGTCPDASWDQIATTTRFGDVVFRYQLCRSARVRATHFIFLKVSVEDSGRAVSIDLEGPELDRRVRFVDSQHNWSDVLTITLDEVTYQFTKLGDEPRVRFEVIASETISGVWTNCSHPLQECETPRQENPGGDGD